ncbi:hypothetical protein GCM10022254_47890 [Actinomadura meridiana]|uniref:DUF4190 domain-containing protein n=1 Tax=Actinomadura meridiana TaxID=559626 RepID=A0ABP8CBI1_9ACTN
MSEQPSAGTGPPGGSGGSAPHKETDRRKGTGRRALWLGAIALLTAFFFYPLGLVLGVAALVVGVRAHRTARRAQGSEPGAVPGIVLGAVGLAFSLLFVSVTAYLWTELNGYQKCVAGSNTTADEKACKSEYYPRIEDKLGLPSGYMDKYGDLL